MSVHPMLMSYYMRLEEFEVERIFPQFPFLSQRFPKEVALQICLCRTLPDELLETIRITRCSTCTCFRYGYVMATRGWCRCVADLRSDHPMYPWTSMKIPVPMCEEEVLIGFTTNPDNLLAGGAGFRFYNRSGNIFLDTRYPPVTTSRGATGASAWTGVGNRIHLLDIRLNETLIVAIDYDHQQIVFTASAQPQRDALRLNLPEELQNTMLFPVVKGRPGGAVDFDVTTPSSSISDKDGELVLAGSTLPGEVGLWYTDPGRYGVFATARSLPPFPRTKLGGTTLTTSGVAALFRRRGLCSLCGIQTHRRILCFRRVRMTNPDVYKGQCLRCNREVAPGVPVYAFPLAG